MSDFQDIKHLIIKNHDIDSCYSYLMEEFKSNYKSSINCTDLYAEFKRVGDNVKASRYFDKSLEYDELVDTCEEGLGEAIYYNGTELHEHLAKYVHMVAPDRFEEEAQEYAQEQE